MYDITIVNVVGTVALGIQLDLNSIALALEKGEYEPEQFPGLIYRIKDPKAAFLIFKSGKMVCTGARSPVLAQEAVNRAVEALVEIGIKGISTDPAPKIEVVNIVASANLNAELNLNQVAVSLGLENVEYEPEQFPGLVYRMYDPKVVLLLFGSGKIICTGSRKVSDVEIAVEKLREELHTLDLLMEKEGKNGIISLSTSPATTNREFGRSRSTA